MENKKNKTVNILIGVIIGLTISLLGIIIYKFVIVGNNINSNEKRINVPINHENKKEDNDFILNEDDVKNWLNSNNGIIDLFFIKSESDFDYNTATKDNYSGFLGLSLLFGGLAQSNSIESITLPYDSGYNYQYSYPIEFIKSILKNYFNVGLEMIDINTLNVNYKDLANFSMDNNKFTIKVVATGLDNYTESELSSIRLDDDKNIIVNYALKDCTVAMESNECTNMGSRELLLKKTSDGYNLLKAYKVN